MSSRAQSITVSNFGGGLVTNSANTSLAFGTGEPTEALDLDNVIILPSGKGITKCTGNTAHNSSAMNAGASVQGGIYYRQADQDEFIVTVCGDKLFSDTALSGTMNDVTGALTITAGDNNKWDLIQFNNNIYGFGGSLTAPDAPFVYTGAGNASALGGTPPSASGGFQHNNRLFAYRTAANPSRVNWSILSNGADWTGTGSGSHDIWADDGDTVVGHAILSNDLVLFFKEKSIHQMVGRSSPFPFFPVHYNIGAISRRAIVVVDGVAYFVSPKARAYVTDGVSCKELSPDINDIWDSLNTSRLRYIEGFYMEGPQFRWIVWMCSTGANTTNNYAIIWDLNNRCWLRRTTGLNGNIAFSTQAGTVYMGAYDGKLYKLAVSNTYTNASTSSSIISMKWRSGWVGNKDLLNATQFKRVIASLVSQTSGTITVKAGYDFSSDSVIATLEQTAAGGVLDSFVLDQDQLGGQEDIIRDADTPGHGNVFQIAFENTANEAAQINNFSLTFKGAEQKRFAAV
jgi:hypothetical protein